MASEFVVTRSFYSWLCGVSLQEKRLREVIPKVLPTQAIEAKKISGRVKQLLEGTTFSERAIYWDNLLGTFAQKHEEAR